MTTEREIMTADVAIIDEDVSVRVAAELLAKEDIGSMPVCSSEGRLLGMLTDRDIVTKVVAAGKDPSAVAARELADQPEIVTIGADDTVEDAVETMIRYKVRRPPVVDGDRLVGMVSQADLARSLPDEKVAELVAAISA